MKNPIAVPLVGPVLLVLSSTAGAQVPEVEGVIGLYPVEANSCIAVEVPADASSPLMALNWYHNDETAAFPKLLLVEGTPGSPPDVTDPGLILETITGESLSWGTVSLETPVTSSTGMAYAVFFFPPYQERTGEGLGGGPGIGYRIATGGPAAYLSRDGLEWVRLHGDYSMAVEATTGMMKGVAARSLSEIGDRLDLPKTEEDIPVLPAVTRLHEPYPNPFNPRVAIAFDLAQAGKVSLRVYDARGRRVRTLISGRKEAGAYTVTWTGDDDRGRSVASGVYYARLVAGGVRQEKTMTLVR